MRGFASAGAAYNAGIRESSGEVMVFAHQDVYLPDGWDQSLASALSQLCTTDPNWAVLGIFGIGSDGQPRGHMYCTGLQKILGKPFNSPVPCDSLDEFVLILKRSACLTFDEQVPGFHFYATDICLQAQQAGLSSYIIPGFCIHNTQGMNFLPWSFWRGYLYMRRKWRQRLPIKTPCINITRWATPLVQHPLQSFYARYLKGEKPGQRVSDPRTFYTHLQANGNVPMHQA